MIEKSILLICLTFFINSLLFALGEDSKYGITAHGAGSNFSLEYDPRWPGLSCDEQFHQMQEAGVKWARVNFRWQEIQTSILKNGTLLPHAPESPENSVDISEIDIEASRNHFDFTFPDRVIAMAYKYGINLLIVLEHPHKWASSYPYRKKGRR
jgi:hypothetical protein